MAAKPTDEALKKRVNVLETVITDQEQEKEVLRTACKEAEYRMAHRTAKLSEANQQLQHEIEERTLAEQALKNSQRLLQTLIDTIAGEVFVKDKNGKYLYVNRAFGKDFGVDPQAVVGKDDAYIFSPEVAAKLQANDRRILASKKAETLEEGGIFNGKNLTYLTNKVPLIDAEGKVLGICGVGFDITRQKKMEKALKEGHEYLEKRVEERTTQLLETIDKLREAEWRYRTVADFTYSWEYWANMDGGIEYISPSCERISGYSPKEFVHNPSLFRKIVIAEDQAAWQKHHQDSRRQPQVREIRFRIRRRDGSIRWIEHACHPVKTDQGQLLGFRASNRDVTQRKKGEIALKKAYSEIKALKTHLEAEQTYLREEIKLAHDHENIIGESEVLKYVLYSVEQIAQTDTTVLILGETGTGKELVARAIHHASNRKDRPLVKVDCAALSANLIESELFGHEKGAFTGAIEKRIGRFELADGATLFLDEIGELPLELQQKLLRVLQDGEFERLGSARVLHADVRVIAATNRDLEEDVKSGRFRRDLWYRLNVFPLSIPPLRDRRDDIPLLVKWVIKKIQRRLGKQIETVPTHVMNELKAYPWPGNVRELENTIERAVIVTSGNRIQLAAPLGAPEPDRHPPTPPAVPMKHLSEMEKEYILAALERAHWNISGKNGAAEMLGLNTSTLRGRMRKHGIRRPAATP